MPSNFLKNCTIVKRQGTSETKIFINSYIIIKTVKIFQKLVILFNI